MKIGHISDIHWLDTSGAHFSDFLNKRISGGINLIAGRSRIHSKETARNALETVRREGCQHLIVTGDLTNLALPGEFKGIKSVLNEYYRDEDMSIVPGNHDYYTGESARHRRFEKMIYTTNPSSIQTGYDDTWPFVKVVENTAIIGLNSARPRPWFVAGGILGSEQIERLKKILALPEIASKFKIAALHHHLVQVLKSPGESLRNLRERKELVEICRSGGVKLIVHGHNHDFTLCKTGDMVISETGSCSVCKFNKDNRAGKLNIYEIEDSCLKSIQTWRFEDGCFKLWRTWQSDALPEFPTEPSPIWKSVS